MKLFHFSSPYTKPIFNPSINLAFLLNCLDRCRNLKQFDQILSLMILTGFIADTFAASRLFKFSPFISLSHSLKILHHVSNPNGFIFNTVMKECLRRKSPQIAINLYQNMLNMNVCTNSYTFPILVQACAERLSIFEGKEVHSHASKTGFDSDVYVRNTLINMYSVCGSVWDARQVFDESPVLDHVSWNSMLAGYVRAEDLDEAGYIYKRMPERNLIASNSMLVLFGKKGEVSKAKLLFQEMPKKDLVSWSVMISCFERNGMKQEALDLFLEMNTDGLPIDEILAVSVLSACSELSVVSLGKCIHCLVVKKGIESFISLVNVLILMYTSCGEICEAERFFDGGVYLDQISWNSLMSGYLRHGMVEKARRLFDSMPTKDVVSWSIIISGCAQRNLFVETLTIFNEMLVEGFRPDEMILATVISACTNLDQGKWIHTYIRENGVMIDVHLGTTLIDMYMKCGCVEDGFKVFNAMEERGISTWNALILGLAMNGLGEKSLAMFSDMKESGIIPNEITFLGILGACRHMGLVYEGRHYFNSMIDEHKIEPNIKHYGCMVDLLGRGGMLKEAEELIQKMPMVPDAAIWGALLGACKNHGDHEMGERIGRKLVDLHPEHDGFHVLLSDIYASKGYWDDVLKIREMMEQNKVMKTPGSSMI